ncbi:MAG: biopolymer transporter ExbD [Deltaproteobacteria bacterium]|nr:biopolymer transporter ExbD [Deltaproteobacteria bacterium]
MGADAGKGSGAISAINVTPFVDVVLVLLVILMVTSVQIVKASLEVNLPSAASGGSSVDSTLNLIIDADGAWKLDGKAIDEAGLAAYVKSETKKNPKLQAVIAADREVKYDYVIRAIDVIKTNGIKKFALNIQRATGG